MSEHAVAFDCPSCGLQVEKVSAVIAEGQEHVRGILAFREDDRVVGWLFAPCGHGCRLLRWEAGRYSPEGVLGA